MKGSTSQISNETIAKYEVMDGCPIKGDFIKFKYRVIINYNDKGEVIPIRLYLSGYELNPSHNKTNNKFSVTFFLNLVLVDEDDRRYFKQQEIELYRKK